MTRYTIKDNQARICDTGDFVRADDFDKVAESEADYSRRLAWALDEIDELREKLKELGA